MKQETKFIIGACATMLVIGLPIVLGNTWQENLQVWLAALVLCGGIYGLIEWDLRRRGY